MYVLNSQRLMEARRVGEVCVFMFGDFDVDVIGAGHAVDARSIGIRVAGHAVPTKELACRPGAFDKPLHGAKGRFQCQCAALHDLVSKSRNTTRRHF